MFRFILVHICIAKFRIDKDLMRLRQKGHGKDVVVESQKSQSHTKQAISSQDLCKKVVSVTGILLEKFDSGQSTNQQVSHFQCVIAFNGYLWSV